MPGVVRRDAAFEAVHEAVESQHISIGGSQVCAWRSAISRMTARSSGSVSTHAASTSLAGSIVASGSAEDEHDGRQHEFSTNVFDDVWPRGVKNRFRRLASLPRARCFEVR